MDLKLSPAEAQLLRGTLADYVPSLRLEVARTEERAMRHLLSQRLDLVERVIQQLPEDPASSSG